MAEKRRITGMLLTGAVYLAAALCLAVLVGIIGYVVIKGLPAISWKLITGVPSVTKGTQGILPFLLNTLYMILLTLLIVLPMTTSRAVWVIVGLLVIVVGVLMAIDRLKPGKLLGDGGNIIDAQ